MEGTKTITLFLCIIAHIVHANECANKTDGWPCNRDVDVCGAYFCKSGACVDVPQPEGISGESDIALFVVLVSVTVPLTALATLVCIELSRHAKKTKWVELQ